MAKWSGNIGYAKTVETAPGVWQEQYVEKHAYGDVLRRSMQYPNSENLNNDVSISNQLSIIACRFAIENSAYIKYAVINGVRWKVTDIELSHPRLTLTLGGVYNAEIANISSDFT